MHGSRLVPLLKTRRVKLDSSLKQILQLTQFEIVTGTIIAATFLIMTIFMQLPKSCTTGIRQTNTFPNNLFYISWLVGLFMFGFAVSIMYVTQLIGTSQPSLDGCMCDRGHR